MILSVVADTERMVFRDLPFMLPESPPSHSSFCRKSSLTSSCLDDGDVNWARESSSSEREERRPRACCSSSRCLSHSSSLSLFSLSSSTTSSDTSFNPSSSSSPLPSSLPTKMDTVLMAASLKREAESAENGATDESGSRPQELERALSFARPTPVAVEVLPDEPRFAHLRHKQRFAVDIGGTLVKLVYSTVSESDNKKLLLVFQKFHSIEECIHFLKGEWRNRDAECFLNGTGGGAYKYAELLEKELGVKVHRTDEMRSLIVGCDYLLRHVEDESFTYHHEAAGRNRYQYKPIDPEAVYPFLLVNIGTGISILKVDSPTAFTRVGGSTMGGGAFIGLGNLVTSATTFDELLNLAERGDHRKVDSLVCDIYGGGYEQLGLPPDIIAGSFGKCSHHNKRKNQNAPATHSEEDVAKSLLLMISNNIGQMAILYGNRYKLTRIYFGGFFIRQHWIAMRTLSFAINFWSQGESEALFMKHEGYLGAVGSFLDNLEASSPPQNGHM